jgi:hypothetical protein
LNSVEEIDCALIQRSRRDSSSTNKQGEGKNNKRGEKSERKFHTAENNQEEESIRSPKN